MLYHTAKARHRLSHFYVILQCHTVLSICKILSAISLALGSSKHCVRVFIFVKKNILVVNKANPSILGLKFYSDLFSFVIQTISRHAEQDLNKTENAIQSQDDE